MHTLYFYWISGKLVIDDGNSFGPAAVIEEPTYVYDLGTLLIIDRILFQKILVDNETSVETAMIGKEDDEQETLLETFVLNLEAVENRLENKNFDIIETTTAYEESTNSTESIIFPVTDSINSVEPTSPSIDDDIELTTAASMDLAEDKSKIIFKFQKLLEDDEISNKLKKTLKPKEKRIVYINNQRVEIEDTQE